MEVLLETIRQIGQMRRAVASSVETLTSRLPPAHADSPAVIVAAIITAAGTAAAAGVITAGNIVVAIINDDDEEEGPIIVPGTRVVAPGTPPSVRRVGDQDLPPALRGFLGRDIVVSAASAGSSGTQAGSEASARATYMFDGDVRNAMPEGQRAQSFTVRDQVTFRLEISDIEDSSDVPLTFSVDNLSLSTIDVADTDGHAEIAFVAVQGEQVLWRWSARVSQGQKPQMTVPPGSSQRVVRQQKDLLIIRNLRIPVEYIAPGADSSTAIEIVMSTEGVGART